MVTVRVVVEVLVNGEDSQNARGKFHGNSCKCICLRNILNIVTNFSTHIIISVTFIIKYLLAIVFTIN